VRAVRDASHLARRFFGSLRRGGPSPEDERWVAGVLSDPERALWGRMSDADRRHAVQVARRAEQELGPAAAPPLLAAALLHDVGKVVAGLGTWGRVFATLNQAVGLPSVSPRFREYRRHASLGAELLERAGSHPLAVTWAREHHLPPSAWTLPAHAARALKAADDD
jgi:hypothetical protein